MHKKSIAKKIAAILLTVVLVAALFPAALFAQAETPDVKPFYLVNWGRGFETGTFDNVYWMPYTWTKTAWFYPEEDRIDIGMYFNGKSTSDMDTAAQWLYEEFSQRPAGTRYINLAAMGTVFRAYVKDVIDFEDGIRLVNKWLDEFLTKYKALGGELDGIAIDLEYNSYTSFYLQTNNCVKYDENGVTKDPKNLDVLQDIVRNERVYQAKIRPQLKELEEQGLFQFYTGGTCKVYNEETGAYESVTTTIDETTGLPDNLGASLGSVSGYRVPIPVSEITTINRYDNDGGVAISRSTWSSVLQRHIVNCIDRAVFDPMIEHYPDAILSDYSHEDIYAWNTGFTGTGSTGTGAKAGNASNGVYYGGGMGEYFYSTGSGSTTRQLYYKPVGQDAAVYDPVSPYSMVLREINNHKNIVASAQQAGTEHTNVWIPYFHYASNTTSYGNTPYYSELVYHLGLTNPEPYFGYIIESEVISKGKQAAYAHDPNYGDYEYALGVTNELLAELTRVAGASDRQPIVTPVDWDDGFVVSGMYAGGRNIWRVSPDTSKISVEDFKVDGTKAPTFTVNGVTITFPQGRIIEDSDITQIGTSGYWVETPADVNPVITKSANHFEETPSFGETFENYNLGEFTAIRYSIDTSLYPAGYRPDTYWAASGTASIVENNGSKAMALTGTTTLTNASTKTTDSNKNVLTVPAQITAGDSYAQQQAWEVTVTMPSSFSGTIKLLSYNTSYDGFQINSSGAVRYPYIYSGGTSGDFTNMGLTLTAGQTYTFKRVLDFTAKTGSYYVYDANGNLLKSLTDKRILTTSQVTSIYTTTSSVTGTVIIDDYKLYPVGVTANLKLYDTVELSQYANYTPLVRSISDTTATRTDKTAYRVSWLNNSGEYKTAVLKNSTTGAVIEQVLMAPGDSGYFTGIVEASASNPVTFALTTESTSVPATPDYENGDFEWAGYAENMGITCYVMDQGYAKLEDALAAATDGQTIVMIADAKLESTAVVDSSIKINTNGHTIALADNFTGDYAFSLAAGGALTWDDNLSIDTGSKTAFGVIGGNLTVSGGTITGQNGILVTGGNLTVTGGTVTATNSAILLSQDAAKTAANVTVTGGALSGTYAFLHKNDNATASENLTVAISGATLTGAVATTEEHFEIQTVEGVQTLHGHTVVIDAAAAATCTEDGLTAGYHYPCCNKVGLAQETIPALGHDWEDATYCGATKYCSVCGITDGDPKEHEFGDPVVTPNNCTENGYTSETCSVCGYKKVYDIVPAAHKPGEIVDENVVAATCTKAGTKDEVRYCTVCGAETSRNNVTTDPATGHTDGNTVVENEVAATCTTDGSYDNVTYCTVCGVETSRQTIPVEATGHTPGEIVVENEVSMTCTDDGSYDNVRYCETCQAEISRETVIIPAPEGGHNEDGFIKDVIIVGNCTTASSYDNVVYCTACGYEHSRENVTTPAPGHKYVIGETHITCKNCDYSKEIGTSTLTIASGNNDAPVTWAPDLAPEMDAAYAKTVDGGIVTEGASASDWNLKVEWPVDGKPTLTMKDATINNDTHYVENQYIKYDIITIKGSADFVIQLEGANYINGRPAATDLNVSAYTCPFGIAAYNTGDLTIRGTNKATDGLYISLKGGNAIDCYYNALTVENATLDIKLFSTTNSYPQHGIVMQYRAAGYEDKTNLTVRNANFSINVTAGGGNPYSSMAIILGKSGTNNAANSGDLLFQNSAVNIVRSNSSTQRVAFIQLGTDSAVTFDRCDVYITSWRIAFSVVPTILNYDSATYTRHYRENNSDKSEAGVVYDPATAGTAVDFRLLEITHTCLAGDPVTETITKGDCCTAVETVTYCVTCNKRTVLESVDSSTKAHTPGTKVELEDQRVGVIGTGTMTKYGLESYLLSDGTTTRYRPATGKYVFQYTCSVCGETWTEEETFKPAILYFLTSGKGASYDATNDRYNYNSMEGNNTSSGYKPTVGIGPGQVKYYTTGEYDTANPGYSHMKELTDATEIANGNWNVKLEYPLYGDPILTLKNATIANNSGLWYGYAGYRDLAPLTIVLEGENSIKQLDRSIGAGPFMLQTNNDVTITGDGTLLLQSHSTGQAMATQNGNLTLDNANITLVRPDSNATSTRTLAIGSKGTGNVTVNGGSITYFGYGTTSSTSKTNEETGETTVTYSSTTGYNNLIAGANVTIKNATITAHGTFNKTGILKSTGDMTISDSTLLLSHGYAYENNQDISAYAVVCGGTLTWDYANGIVGKTANAYTYADAHINPTTITYPAEMTDITDISQLDGAKTNRYLEIAPVKARAKFAGSNVAVENDLTLMVAIKVADIPTGSVAHITRTRGEEVISTTTQELTATSGYHIIRCTGIAAKEMYDEITVVVKNNGVEVSEVKTDSIYDYATRMLAQEQGTMSDAKYAAKKTVLVELLNYGTMAQIQFEHGIDKLANASLTPIDWTHAATEMQEVPANAATVTLEEGMANTTYKGTNFALNTNIAMLIAVSNNDLGTGSYAKVYVDGVLKETITATDSGSNAIYTSNALVAADGRKTVTFELYTAEDVKVATVTDSMADYVGRNIAKGPHLANLMKYCDAAAAYFAA